MTRKKTTKIHLIGDDPTPIEDFYDLSLSTNEFKTLKFNKLSRGEKFVKINQTLLHYIENKTGIKFLLPAINYFINQINELKLLNVIYQFSLFEYWLIHQSNLSPDQQYKIRSKIVGRYIPREQYQYYFPVGMGRKQHGSHYVVAHLSPDVDTTIASFWGWVDAFAAAVSSGQHFWCIPGGPPDAPSMILFEKYFGKNSIQNFSRTSKTIRVLSTDILTKDRMVIKSEKTLVDSMEHGYHDKAVILVDENGYYVGDFRSKDVEQVRQVIILIKACLTWFQNNFQSELITLFSKKRLSIKEFDSFYRRIFGSTFRSLKLVEEFSPLQKELLEKYLIHVLDLKQGLSTTISQLAEVYSKLTIENLNKFEKQFDVAAFKHLFDKNGILIENRPKIFRYLSQIFIQLLEAVTEIASFIERLDNIMAIKTKVLKFENSYLTYKDDVDSIKQKMNNQPFLTVVYQESNNKLLPLGIIWAEDIRKPTLGSVTWRDFSNFDEVQMPSYLNVISVIDHHKSSFKTISTPSAIIGDTQSCNILIAEQEMLLNEQYSTAGMTLTSVNKQIATLSKNKRSLSNARLLQRLYQRRSVIMNSNKHDYYIDPYREFIEYLFLVHATIDDTDLLSKVSYRDVICIAKLLNLMKSIQLKKEVEIINFDEIPKNPSFPKLAAQKILQNEDMYSIYNKVYALREKGIEKLLQINSDEDLQKLFSDTKEQNGCCRVGQIKLFRNNIPSFLKVLNQLRTYWYKTMVQINESNPKIDLCLQMFSTITSADEVYKSKKISSRHQDELWFWASPQMPGFDHLNYFLLRFKNAPELMNETLELELLGPNYKDFRMIFEENFPNLKIIVAKDCASGTPIAVLRYNAGLLNSRKSMISPYLPQLIT